MTINYNSGYDQWNKAKKLIPGGTQLLSKRAEMFLPKLWPAYYKKAKGVEIWDLDDNKYTDMSIMGIGSCILGYSDDDVNKKVKEAIDLGNMATLCCPEEIELAELLLNHHNWADMVRYAKTGGEAMTIAVRIGRAYTKKDKIAFCGYHGWHDWYLSSNIDKEGNLNDHLLPGLKPLGVPKCLKGTALPFKYNHIEDLEKIIENNCDIGVIVMEPVRHHEPEKGFLNKVKKIANEIGAVLIFDEITSGCRVNVMGAYEKYGVNPDIIVYGKAISNGHPMACIIGKENVMDIAQETFISSTYWTERVGCVASIATITKLKKNNVPNHLINIGNKIKKDWKELSKEHELDIEVMGIPPLATFKFNYENSLELHTLFTQEMLKREYLASKSIYVSYAHTEEIVEKYMEGVCDVFGTIKKGLEENKIRSLLEGPIAHTGFKRLN